MPRFGIKNYFSDPLFQSLYEASVTDGPKNMKLGQMDGPLAGRD